jgi:hypothetical protein
MANKKKSANTGAFLCNEKVTNMKKTLLVMLILLLLLVGCGRSKGYKNAASHLGEPRSVQLIPAEGAPVNISDKGDVLAVMAILDTIELRKLTVDEEIDLVLVQGKTLNATEMRFRDLKGNVHKAFLLADNSVMVVEGAVGDSEQRRDLYLSAPGQTQLQTEIQKHLTPN